MESFVQITNETYDINKDVRFTQDLFVNNLTVVKFLNSIPVRADGNLDVLLKDIPEQQSITGIKSFENLELHNPIRLQGKIGGKNSLYVYVDYAKITNMNTYIKF